MTYSLHTDSIVKGNCILLVTAEDRQTYDTNRTLTYTFLLNYKLMLPECNFNIKHTICRTGCLWNMKELGIVHTNFVWCAVMPVWYNVTESLVNCHYSLMIKMYRNKFCLVYCCWQAAYWSECTVTSPNLTQYILLCSWNIQKQMAYYAIQNNCLLTALCIKHTAVKMCLDLCKNCLPFTHIPWCWRSRGFQ